MAENYRALLDGQILTNRTEEKRKSRIDVEEEESGYLKRLKRHQDNQATPSTSTSDSAPKLEVQPLRVWPHPGSDEIQASDSSENLSLSLVIPKDESFTDDVPAPLAVIPPVAGQIPLRRRGKEPASSPLLYMQANHKSETAQKDTVNNPCMRECKVRAGRGWPIDPLTTSFVDLAGFKNAGLTSAVEIDAALLHALAERWRPETHTFHLPQGEMTITLQDVAMILGLRIDGPAVTDFYRAEIPSDANINNNTIDISEQLFGIRPQHSDFKKGTLEIKVTWLKQWEISPKDPKFQPDSEQEAQRRARAYIMALLGGCLFSNTSGGYTSLEYIYFLRDFAHCSTFSWASAVLSYTYRGLCKWVSSRKQVELSCCGVLLQVWCWVHIGVGRPTLVGQPPQQFQTVGCWWSEKKTRKKNVVPRCRFYYRDQLIPLKKIGIDWMPWSEQVMRYMPPIATQGWELSMIRLPLIHFNCVEWQLPDRVYRQFGLPQPIPEVSPNDRSEWDRLHCCEKWKKTTATTWVTYHYQYIQIWNNRWKNYSMPKPIGASQSEYMNWYHSVTNNLVYYHDYQAVEEEEQVEAGLKLIPTQGYFDRHGNNNQVMLEGLEYILKQQRKVLSESQDLYTRKRVEKSIMRIRSLYHQNDQRKQFDELMAQELSRSSDEEEEDMDG